MEVTLTFFRSFLVLVVSLVVYSLYAVVILLWGVFLFIQNDSKETGNSTAITRGCLESRDMEEQMIITDLATWFGLCVVSLVIHVLLCASVVHLLSFHVMLCCQKKTTFSYIKEQRSKRQVGPYSTTITADTH